MTLTLSQDETATLRWALESALRVASGNLANGQRIAGNRASSRARRDGLVPQRQEAYDRTLAAKIAERQERVAKLEALLARVA